MELSAVSNIGSQPAFLAGRGNRARKIARKIEQRLPEIQRRRAQREAWNTRQRFFDMKNNETTTAKAATAAATAGTVAVIASQHGTTTSTKPVNKKEQTVNSIIADELRKLEAMGRPKPTYRDYYVYFSSKPYNMAAYYYNQDIDFRDISEDIELIDTFDMQKALADKIVTTPRLRNSYTENSISDLLDTYLIPDGNLKQDEKDRIIADLQERTDARLKLLDEYANNENWQKYNDTRRQTNIETGITDIVMSTTSIKYADFVIDALNKVAEDRKFYNMSEDVLLRFIQHGIDMNIIQKIALNEKLCIKPFLDIIEESKYSRDKRYVQTIIQILDTYLSKCSDKYKYNETYLKLSLDTVFFNIKENPVELLAQELDSLSSSELIKPRKKNSCSESNVISHNYALLTSKYFNLVKSFDYFANGPFKDIPEYLEAGNSYLYDRQYLSATSFMIQVADNSLDTMEFQKELANKILKEDSLLNNEFMRSNLFTIISLDYEIKMPENAKEKAGVMAGLRKRTDAKLKLLDFYAKHKELHEDKDIYREISWLVGAVRNMEECNFIIDVLSDKSGKYQAKENYINDKTHNFYSELNCYIRYRIPIDIIKKIMSNKNLEKACWYSNIDNAVNGNKGNAEKISKLFDYYLKNYPDYPITKSNRSNGLERIILDCFTTKDTHVGMIASNRLKFIDRTTHVNIKPGPDSLELAIQKMDEMFGKVKHKVV